MSMQNRFTITCRFCKVFKAGVPNQRYS